jgi:hypothetical protein
MTYYQFKKKEYKNINFLYFKDYDDSNYTIIIPYKKDYYHSTINWTGLFECVKSFFKRMFQPKVKDEKNDPKSENYDPLSLIKARK